MKKNSLFVALAASVMLLSSCGSSKDVPYFQNINEVTYNTPSELYDAKIMPKDILTITVSTTDPKAATPFNLTISEPLSITGRVSTSGGTLQTYLVDNNGDIVYPVIGTLHVKGMTVRECEALIKQKITPYLSATENPVVTVKMSNFKVSVFGEVARPNTFTVSTGKINVLEALAQAGDMTIYGKRDNVTIIREDADGKKTYHQMDLRDANIINDPYFYLQQNDVVYVEPNTVKTRNAAIGTSTTLTFSAVSILISISSLVVNILRK